MVGREPEPVGVLVQIRKAQRARIDDEQAENPVALGQRPDRGPGGIVDAHGDEVGEPRARFVEDAERAICGVDHLHRRRDDPVQHAVQVQVGPDGQYTFEQPPQLPRTRHVFHGRDCTPSV